MDTTEDPPHQERSLSTSPGLASIMNKAGLVQNKERAIIVVPGRPHAETVRFGFIGATTGT